MTVTGGATPQAVNRRPWFVPRSVHAVHSATGTGVSLSNPVFPCQYRSAVISSLKADSHIACRAHAVPLPCRAVNSGHLDTGFS